MNFLLALNLQGRQTNAGFWIPNFYGLLRVATAADEEPLLGVPVDAADVGAVSAQDPLLLAPDEVPDAHRPVVRRRRQLNVRRRETENPTETVRLFYNRTAHKFRAFYRL